MIFTLEDGRKIYLGKFRAKVLDKADPEKRGRIKVEVFGLMKESDWIECCVPMPGFFGIPEVGQMVFVEFLEGSTDYPVWVGTWYGQPGGQTDAPFEGDETNYAIKSPNGSSMKMDKQGNTESKANNMKSESENQTEAKSGGSMKSESGGGMEMNSGGTTSMNSGSSVNMSGSSMNMGIPTVIMEGASAPSARLGDKVMGTCTCGATFEGVIIQGSSVVRG